MKLTWRMRLRRVWDAIRVWWVNPAPTPEEIKANRPKHHRPVPIELGFFLHADGTVYQRSRTGAGDRKVHSDELVALVHQEYAQLIKRARSLHRRRLVTARLREFLSLQDKGIDTAKDGAV